MSWDNVQKAIDKSLYREGHVRRDKVFYASEVGSCKRKIYYKHFDPRNESLYVLKSMMMGTIIHDWIQEKAKEQGAETERRVSVPDLETGLVISGRIDILSEWMPIELKTTSNLRYTVEPSPSHIDQIMLYMCAINAPEGKLVYVDKRNLEMKEFTVTYDKNRVKEILKRMNEIHTKIETKTLPDKCEKDSAWMCKNCPYGEDCNEDKNLGVIS